MVNIAILGCGTVGSGVVQVLRTNEESINKKAGKKIIVKYILDRKSFEDEKIQKVLTRDFNDILNDDEVKVVVEVMGGVEPAYTFVKSALLKGKHVVTSNKELVAKHGAELLEIAKQKNINFLFEASVGGGIPIIRPLNQSLTADEIYEITGILNGTTNYILSKMSAEGLDFATVLKEAQDKGYAERNPEADVEGYDACRKIAILSSLAYGMHVDYEDIYTEGITKITKEDMLYAKKLNCQIKLLAESRKVNDNVNAMVSPVLLNNEHPLAMVNDVFNAIFVKGNVIGDVMFYGKGAGKLPTASAVVADIVDAVKHINTNIIYSFSTKTMDLMDIKEVKNSFFVRIKSDNLEDAKKIVYSVFNSDEYVEVEGLDNEFAFIVKDIKEQDFNQKLNKLNENKSDILVQSVIRIKQ